MTPAQACHTKYRYPTWYLGMRALLRMPPLEIPPRLYRCTRCKGYHITKRGKIRPGRV